VPWDINWVCHSFIGINGAKPGEIIFLSDCTHALAGQVRPLPELPTENHGWDDEPVPQDPAPPVEPCKPFTWSRP
jgi:hypothetical protein